MMTYCHLNYVLRKKATNITIFKWSGTKTYKEVLLAAPSNIYLESNHFFFFKPPPLLPFLSKPPPPLTFLTTVAF